jgi:hypothetical protein
MCVSVHVRVCACMMFEVDTQAELKQVSVYGVCECLYGCMCDGASPSIVYI